MAPKTTNPAKLAGAKYCNRKRFQAIKHTVRSARWQIKIIELNQLRPFTLFSYLLPPFSFYLPASEHFAIRLGAHVEPAWTRLTPVFIWTLEPCQTALGGVELDWTEPVRGRRHSLFICPIPGNLLWIPLADFGL